MGSLVSCKLPLLSLMLDKNQSYVQYSRDFSSLPLLGSCERLTFNAYTHISFPFCFFVLVLFFNSWKDFETSAEKEKPFRKLILIWVGERLRQLLFVCVHICATARDHSDWHSKMTLLRLSSLGGARQSGHRCACCSHWQVNVQGSITFPLGHLFKRKPSYFLVNQFRRYSYWLVKTWQKYKKGVSSPHQWQRGIVPLHRNMRLMELFLHIVSLCTINTFTRCFYIIINVRHFKNFFSKRKECKHSNFQWELCLLNGLDTHIPLMGTFSPPRGQPTEAARLLGRCVASTQPERVRPCWMALALSSLPDKPPRPWEVALISAQAACFHFKLLSQL